MANLVELFDNIVQMQNLNGVPLANGKMYVYALGRTRLMDTWSDVDGESLNSNPIILDAAGQCRCYVTDDFDYTVVVTDEYNNEIFSIDKYLYSKGSHSHADVAVAPSETIAVSSYHVGECTIYVPYLTGQLGKVYEGIDPIVVNNTEDKISAQHVPLGVQDPLYFVQDDEEGCIIGFSGETVPEGVMVESALGFENDKITGYNGSAFSAGNEYEEGSYISIDNNVISVTGLSPVPSDTASTGLVAQVSADIVSQIPSTAGLATTAQLDEKLDKADSANFYPMNSNPSGYISELPSDLATTGWVDSQGYLTAVDIPESANWNSTYNTVSANSAQWAGGTANPQIPVTGINGIKISESGDKVVFEVSGDYYTNDNPSGFITGVPADMATTGDIADLAQSISETYQPIGNYQTAGDYYSASNPSGFITGVDLSDYATTAELADKQDITGMTAYQPVGNYQTAGDYLTTADSANFYTTANESGFISEVPAGTMNESGFEYDANNKISGYNGSAFAGDSTPDMSQYVPYSATNLAVGINNVADQTGFAQGSGNVAGYNSLAQGKNNYAITESMTQGDGNSADYYSIAQGSRNSAYMHSQAFGRHTSANNTGMAIGSYNKITDAAFVIGNGSGKTTRSDAFVIYHDGSVSAAGKISANGVELGAGGDVPEGVMVESGLEYNAVNEISGYSGSAIAQYGAEKQWLTHDDTLCHISNSAQYALGVALPNISADLARMMGVDETVLWEGTDPLDQSCLVNGTRETAALNEPLSSFNKIRIYAVWNPWSGNFIGCNTFEYPGTNEKGGYIMNDCTNQGYIAGGSWSASGTTFKLIKHWQAFYPAAKETSNGLGGIFKVVGIGRKN